jgi:hypothetical protein
MLSLAAPVILGLTLAEKDATDAAADVPSEPRFVNIVGACTSPAPRVVPPRVTVNGVDDVQWRDPSGQADSWTIEPKEPGVWPFDAPVHGARRGEAAQSGRPASSTVNGQPVEQGQVYSYKVTILCPGGVLQIIDPDIVIGEI